MRENILHIDKDSLLKELYNQNGARESKGLLKVKTALEWFEISKNSPIPQMLFGEFWFEGELCILFADTNLGKSILAVQIGDSISKGKEIKGLKLEANAQIVLYLDFEMATKQFELRYSIKSESDKTCKNHYNFDDNFKRIELNPDAEIPTNISFEDFLNKSIEQCIVETGARIVIIDNITFLRTENEKAKDALPLMKELKALKSKYNLSILALAHTPKRDLTKPITRNDLQGSKMLINFVDSCFAIGESHTDKHLRYLKQIKARNTEIIYDTEHVLNCQIQKPDNFIEFEFSGIGNERMHLKQYSEKDRQDLIAKAKELSSNGYSQREIAKELSISVGSVNNYLKK